MKRILLMGTAGCGKTALLNRLERGTFESKYLPNERAFAKVFQDMEWIDLPGLYRFDPGWLQYVGQVDVIVMVYNMGSRLSAKAIKDLKARARATFGPTPMIAIGTGSDIRHRQVREPIKGLANVQVSSKSGHNMDLCLRTIRELSRYQQIVTTEALNKYKEELMAKTCHPSRYFQWCLDTEEQKDL